MVDLKKIKDERDAAYVTKAGQAFYEELRPQLEPLPVGSYVVIAVETGEFVTGPSLTKAADAFERKHGDVPAYVRRIGQLTRV